MTSSSLDSTAIVSCSQAYWRWELGLLLCQCHGESGFPRWGHPRALSPSACGIPEYDTRSEYGIPNYSPWVILHPLDGTGAGAL